MKHWIYTGAVLLAALSVAGCNSYKAQLDSMKERTERLEQLCGQYNEQLRYLRTLISVVESKDMVTGFSSIKDDSGKAIGYRILFLHHDPVILYHGTDGILPYVGSKRDANDIYYWTIRYGDGTTDYLRDENGNPVQCMGEIPYITIRNKVWYITYDGVTYTELGPADGTDADTIFSRFQQTENSIRVTMSDGSSFEIPLYATYSALRSEVELINGSVEAQRTLINAFLDGLVYIKSVSPIMENGSEAGTRIELSDGKACEIRNTVQSNVPRIVLMQDGTSGNYYWAMAYGDRSPGWILSQDATRISAMGNAAATPVVGVDFDGESGNYYWTWQLGDAPAQFILDEEGKRIPAVQAASHAIFKAVDNSDDVYLRVEMITGEVYQLPKAYTVEVETTLYMRPNTSAYVPYTVYGDNYGTTRVTVIAQDGFSARLLSGNRIMIDAPSGFVSDRGQVVLIFDVCGTGTRIITRTIDIKNPGGVQ